MNRMFVALRRIAWMYVCGWILLSVFAAAPPPAQAAAELPAPQWPLARHCGWGALKVSWRAVDGADCYAVYRWSAPKRRYVLKGRTRALSWRDRSVRPDRRYRYKVAACRRSGGGMVPGKRTYWVEAVAYSRGADVVNPGRPKVKRRKIAMELARRCSPYAMPMGVRVVASEYGSRVGSASARPFSEYLRWRTNTPSVMKASLAENGEWLLCARRAGVCKLRAVAANGSASPPVSVAVRDLSLLESIDASCFAEPQVAEWLEDMRAQVSCVIRASAKLGLSGEVSRSDLDGISYDGTAGTADAAFKKWATSGAVGRAVADLLSHDVDGVRVDGFQVRDGFTLFFNSDTLVGTTYTVSYLPAYGGQSFAKGWSLRTTHREP